MEETEPMSSAPAESELLDLAAVNCGRLSLPCSCLVKTAKIHLQKKLLRRLLEKSHKET
jgi:hypothetical protein